MQTVIFGVLAAFDAILLILVIYLLSRYGKSNVLMTISCGGRDAESMEDTILGLEEALRDLRSEDRANKEAIRVLNKNQRASYQKFGIVRYNAFKDMGGKMSFAIALLDYTNTGFIMNTVHSREGCYLYIRR